MSTFTAAGRDSMHTGAKPAQIPAPTGLIDRCKCINDQLAHALQLTIEITGQHYDEEKTAVIDTVDVMGDLAGWLRSMNLKADNLVKQLRCMKEQF